MKLNDTYSWYSYLIPLPLWIRSQVYHERLFSSSLIYSNIENDTYSFTHSNLLTIHEKVLYISFPKQWNVVTSLLVCKLYWAFRPSIVLEKITGIDKIGQHIEKFTPGRGKNNSNIFFTQLCKPKLVVRVLTAKATLY